MENFDFSWQDLTVSVKKRNGNIWRSKVEHKIIIDKVSGKSKCGSLVAVLGPSGAGKTTFLAALAGKINRDAGQLLINNFAVTNDQMKGISGYMFQHFVATESLTVREHLIFMSALKLLVEKHERYAVAKRIIMQLNLEPHEHTTIKNLSGGEKRRVDLAVELLGNPMILCCDEPTTGLDSTSACSVVDILHKTALSGKLVISTIHQPSSQLYSYFTHVILMSKGTQVFQGDKQETKDFFESMNLRFPTSYNPADFYMQHLSRWDKQSVELKSLDSPEKGFPARSSINVRKPKRRFLVELPWLVWKNYTHAKRSLVHHAAHFGLLVVTAFIIAAIYSNAKEDDQNSVQNYKGLLFLITSELIFTHLYASVYTFPEESNVFIREQALYSPYAYFISKIMVMVPKCIIQPSVFFLIIFLQVHFSHGWILVVKMVTVLSVGCISATAYGLCISSVFQSLEFIELVIMPLDLLSMLLAGILVKVDSIPPCIRWLKYTSPFFYVYESLSIIQWTDMSDIACSNTTALPCYRNGQEVLLELGFHTGYSDVVANVINMCLLSFGFCFIGYLGILRKQKTLM